MGGVVEDEFEEVHEKGIIFEFKIIAYQCY